MKQYLTPHDIANTVRMMRPVYGGSVVLVEGDSDARVYGRFVDDDHCRVVTAHGKSNALLALGILEKGSFMGVLAIVDSDFWKLEETGPESPNVMVTDTHDLETMIISSEAMETVLTEFGSPPKMKRLGRPVSEVLVKAALPIGYLRFISSSKQDNLSLRFKNISYAAVLVTENKTVRTDVYALLREVKAKTPTASFDTKEMKERVVKLLRSGRDDPWQVCRGHDMVHILSIGLREVFGNRNAKTISYDQIDRIMRIAYGFAEFSHTKLYSLLKEWERANTGFRVIQ